MRRGGARASGDEGQGTSGDDDHDHEGGDEVGHSRSWSNYQSPSLAGGREWSRQGQREREGRIQRSQQLQGWKRRIQGWIQVCY